MKQFAARILLLLICQSAAAWNEVHAADLLDVWHWRNPHPSGSTGPRIERLNGQYIIPTSGAGLLTSTDGSHWTAWTVPFDGDAKHIAYGNGQYVVVGAGASGGVIASSPDLRNWTVHPTGAAESVDAIAFGNGVFAAVGRFPNGGVVSVSTTGTNWIPQPPLLQSGFGIDIAFGNGRFVLVTYSNNTWTSTNALDWTAGNWTQVPGPIFAFTSLSFANGKFFACGARGTPSAPAAGSSPDGIDWEPFTDARPSGNDTFRVVHGNGSYIGFCNSPLGPLSSSQDGKAFTRFTGTGFDPWAYATFGLFASSTFANGLFVVPPLQTSPNGTNWSPTALTPTNAPVRLDDIAFGNGRYAAVGQYNGPGGIVPALLNSTNGVAFSYATSGLPALVSRLRFANGLFHAVGRDGALLRSTNGIEWVTRNPATSAWLYDLDYGAGTWVAVGGPGTITASSTGNAWSLKNSGTVQGLAGITYGNGMFVVVGDQGTVLTSPDGNTWTPQFADTQSLLRKVAYGNGIFVAIGSDDTVLSSPDGVEWSVHSTSSGADLLSIAFGDGVFCIGTAGTHYTSVDGVSWTRRYIGGAAGNVRFLNGTFLTVGAAGWFNNMVHRGNILQSGPVIAPVLSAAASQGVPEITITAAPLLLLRLESSADLLSWQDLGLVTNSATGSTTFRDSGVPVGQARFYRTVAP